MESQAPPPLKSSGSILDSAEVRLVLKVIQKNWWIALSLAAIGYTIGYFYAYRLPDIYAAQTQLIFKNTDQYNPNTLISGYGSYQGYVDNANETRVIQSYDLIKKVIDKLNINVSYYIEGRLRKTEVYSSVPFKVTPYYLNPAFYEKEVNFTILDKYHYRIGYLKGDHQYTQDGNFGDDFINSDMKLHISSTMDLDQTALDDVKLVEYQFKVHNTATLVGSFRSSMAVSSPDYTNIMVISLRDLIPNRAVAFLDTLDNLYLENSITTQIQRNINTINYIDKEMEFVSGIIDTIDVQIENYKEKKNILDFDKEGSEYYTKYEASAAEKVKILAQISSLNDLEQYIIEGKDPEFMPPSIYLEGEDNYISQLTSKLYSTQIKVMEALSTNTEQSQNITDAKKEIKRITDEILYYINNLRKALNNKIAVMDTTMTSSMNEIRTIPEKRRGLINMQRQEDVNTRLYETLLEKRANTIIEKASIIPQTKVLEKARSVGVVDPDRTAIYYKYMLIGLIIAGIIVAIRLFFFDRIESIQELKSKTSMPVLGEILSAPLLADLPFAVEDNPKSTLNESFRTLRTNLQYMFTNPSQKVILFTSNGPSEGKTFCSMNISAILAKAEKKVLLLEFDLHNPRIHKV